MNLLRGVVVSIITFALTMFLLFASDIGSSTHNTDNIAFPIAISLVIGLFAAIGTNKKND